MRRTDGERLEHVGRVISVDDRDAGRGVRRRADPHKRRQLLLRLLPLDKVPLLLPQLLVEHRHRVVWVVGGTGGPSVRLGVGWWRVGRAPRGGGGGLALGEGLHAELVVERVSRGGGVRVEDGRADDRTAVPRAPARQVHPGCAPYLRRKNINEEKKFTPRKTRFQVHFRDFSSDILHDWYQELYYLISTIYYRL